VLHLGFLQLMDGAPIPVLVTMKRILHLQLCFEYRQEGNVWVAGVHLSNVSSSSQALF
jgi:hypothetical protein